MSEKVLVLLSAYNGEEYIEQQLESIRKQKGIEISCLIRDDGSTDGTAGKLREYCEKYNNFSCYSGKNLGVVKSFNELMDHPEVLEYEYIAFCDQDDYWMDTKLLQAVETLQRNKRQDIPLLYCSNLYVTDSELTVKQKMRKHKPKFTVYTALVENIATGCTQLFNKKAAELYREGLKSSMVMHDYWMYLVCIYMGQVIYSDDAYILYRQHITNAVGYREKKVEDFISSMRRHEGKRMEMLNDFLAIYESQISKKNAEILKRVTNYKKEMKKKVEILCMPQYHGHMLKVTLAFKMRIALGKFY